MVVFSIDFYLFESSHNLFLCQNVSNVICINVFTHFPVIPLNNVTIRFNIKHFSILETHWFLFVTPRLKCFIFDKVFACFDFQVFDADKFLFALPSSVQEADLVISCQRRIGHCYKSHI